MVFEKLNQPIELGSTETLLAEGRLKAKREQIPFMEALKIVIRERLKETLSTKSENKVEN